MFTWLNLLLYESKFLNSMYQVSGKICNIGKIGRGGFIFKIKKYFIQNYGNYIRGGPNKLGKINFKQVKQFSK